MQTLVEGQTLLHDGRYRFLRRIGSGTFAVIMRYKVNTRRSSTQSFLLVPCPLIPLSLSFVTSALDMQHDRHVAIKCVRQQELNALGEREAAILRQIKDRDADGACAVVRLLSTFEEQGHFCLVLELLGPPVLEVRRWGPWRHALSKASAAPNQTLQLLNRTRQLSAPDGLVASTQQTRGKQRKQDVDGPDVDGLLAPLVSLLAIRQMAVHLCGALAFLHDQGLIHADVKPENVVRSSPEAPLRPSTSLLLACSSPVKLVDFGNCLDANELAAYADVDARGGFDVQTVTYRAPEVAAGLLLCSAMDMWSLGCLLLECASGKPLFTLPPLETSMQERADVIRVENANLLEQIQRVVTNGVALDATCAPYHQSSACYNEETAEECQRVGHHKQVETLQTRLQAAAPGNHHFHDFICSLLDVNPATRVTAKQALFHPFLQAFFPFKTVFAQSGARPASSERETSLPPAPASTGADTQRKAWRSRSRENEEQKASDRVRKRQKSAESATSARSKDLRQVLKIIPQHHLSFPPH